MRPEDVGPHRLRFVETGGTTLELVEPLAPDAPIAKFLENRGAGLHHLCLRVQDIDEAMAALKATRRAADRRGAAPGRARLPHRVPPSGEHRAGC